MRKSSKFRLLFVFLIICLIVPITLVAEPISIEWYNYSERPLVSAEDCVITDHLQNMFGVQLILSGGPRGSREAMDGLYTKMFRQQELPDIFPWHLMSRPPYPNIEEMYSPISVSLIKAYMPHTYRMLSELSNIYDYPLQNVWDRFSVNGNVYALPLIDLQYAYPSGYLGRKDILDDLNEDVPATIEDWERVFEKYKVLYPSKTPWGALYGGNYFFHAIFGATGVNLEGYVARDRKWERGCLQPEMKTAMQTLQSWHEKGYIEVFEQRDYRGNLGFDTTTKFIDGEVIVTGNVYPNGGNWVCDPPYIRGSIEYACKAKNPEAEFVLGPYPVYEGVGKPIGRSVDQVYNPLQTSQLFGFNKRMVDDPEKLAIVMQMVDTIAAMEDVYLVTQFGIEGIDWTWQQASGQRFPELVDENVTDRNIGKYWLFPYTTFDERFKMHPSVRISIDKYYNDRRGLYAPRNFTGESYSYNIPYESRDASIQGDVQKFSNTNQDLHSAFIQDFFLPILYGDEPVDHLDNYRDYYYKNGGDFVEAMLEKWVE